MSEFPNGNLPDSVLAPIAEGRLRKDAAAAWNTMNVQARRLGVELLPSGSVSSYRTFAEQIEQRAEWCARGECDKAAVPGQSNHGRGLAVDLKTPEMRAVLDLIGEHYGWSKATSDAATEWWHIAWVVGSWTGPDPGPYGEHQTNEEDYMIAAAQNSKGHIELFVETKTGEVFHTWQKDTGGWYGAQAGKRFAGWQSMGKPGS